MSKNNEAINKPLYREIYTVDTPCITHVFIFLASNLPYKMEEKKISTKYNKKNIEREKLLFSMAKNGY